MTTTAKRVLWAVLLIACLAVAAFSLRGMFAFGEPPISAASPVPVRSSAAESSARSAPASSQSAVASEPSGATGAPSDAGVASSTASDGVTSAPAGAGSSSENPTEASSAPPSPRPAASAPAAPGTRAPASSAASEDASGSDDEAAAVMTGPAASWDEITAAPTHVDVYADGSQVVGADIAPVQMTDDGEINPEPQTVGWYGPPQWDTVPGERSRYPGVLAGHVIHSGAKDVFWNLQDLKEGALVVLTYDDGTQAAFRTDRDVVSMDKDDLTGDPAYAWAWELPSEGHALTLITCDLVDGSGMTGWSTNNWVTIAERVA